jgi:ribosomal protein S18
VQSKNSKIPKSNITVKNYIKDNLIFIFFPREAGGNFLKTLVELGLKTYPEQKAHIEKIKTLLDEGERKGLHTDELIEKEKFLTHDFLKKIIQRLDNQEKHLVFCDHYYALSTHESFFHSFDVNKFIIIKSDVSNELLNIRRKKHDTPLMTEEEIQLNSIFAKYMKNEFTNAKIVEIEYKDLKDLDSYVENLEQINKRFGTEIPINECKELVQIYLDKVI